MTSTSQGTAQGRTQARQQEPSGWAGWVVFAGAMLILVGIFQVIQGLVAVFDDGFYLVRPSGLVVNVNYTTWGWVHIIVGCIVAAAGVGVLDGRIWARVIGVGVAFVSALISLGFLSAYPIWAILMIALAVVVIMALTVHGSAIRSDV